jgi:threonine/homoserine/homoserine lactone efflux protein
VAFTLTALLLIAIPGPSVLFVISRSLTLGHRAGLASVIGNATGVYVQMVAVGIGLGTIVAQSLTVFTIIKLVGALYLIYLGAQTIRHRQSLVAALGAHVDVKSHRRILLDAFLVGVANPKAVVFFAAILPQFVNRNAGHVPLQMLVLGAVFFCVALVSDGAWALAAGSVRAWLIREPLRLRSIGGIGGLAMIGIGIKLAATGRRD